MIVKECDVEQFKIVLYCSELGGQSTANTQSHPFTLYIQIPPCLTCLAIRSRSIPTPTSTAPLRRKWLSAWLGSVSAM